VPPARGHRHTAPRAVGGGPMSLSFRQRHHLRCMRHTLSNSAPQLASMLVIFARLYAGEDLPAQERAKSRMLVTLRALACAAWAVACLCGRALRACGRGLLRSFGWLLWPCGRLLLSCGQLLRRAAVCCLIVCSFLPAGFRLTAGAWLVAHRGTASVPPSAHRKIR
jgi:hypothetical protein